MTDLVGRRLLFAVGQAAFEARSYEGGPLNPFCTLAPLAFLPRGERVDPEAFPNNGLVWWMLRPDVIPQCQPGRLMTGILEIVPRFDDRNPEKSLYQVKKESVEAVRGDDCWEVLTIPDDFGSLRTLVNGVAPIHLNRPAASKCLVRWRGGLHGPFSTLSEEESRGIYKLRLKPASCQEITCWREASLQGAHPGLLHALEAEVSLDQMPRTRNMLTHTCRYELIFSASITALTATAGESMSLESDADLLRRVSKTVLSRRKRQEFGRLLDEIGELLADKPLEEAVVLRAVASREAGANAALEHLASALIESGHLEEQTKRAIDERFARHLEENAARAQTEIRRKIEETARELDDLRRDLTQQRAERESQARQARADLDRELSARRIEADRTLAEREAAIVEKQNALEDQRVSIAQNLSTLAERFENARHDVLKDFLAIVPLLEQVKLLPGAPPTVAGGPAGRAEPAVESEEPFALPAFVFARDGAGADSLSEEAFVERFRTVVRAKGFVYRDLELLAYHVSVKSGDLTILGGVSGTGKSSLPRLYAEALAGGNAPAAGGRFLEVAVSPSWLDSRDLLGHVNALQRRFEPAESGLLPHLIAAHEEHARGGSASGLYLVMLDEMNLAHVEHYFSPFLQSLERPQGERELRVFDPRSVNPASALLPWATLSLPESLRFVGTVNFDETTKQLSGRLLDRANLIVLRPQRIGDLAGAAGGEPPQLIQGPPVTLGLYRSWQRLAPLQDGASAALIDQLRPQLAALGCPINPRRFRALQAFVASAPPNLMSPAQALDLQIAQRLLPQVRGLFTPAAQQAFRSVRNLLENHSAPLPESLTLLDEIASREASSGITFEE